MPLRIAMLASNVIRIPPTPPEKYVPAGWSGAPELVVHLLTEELAARGHDVTLFASGDSATSAKLVSVTPTATIAAVGKGPHEQYEHLLISKCYQMARAGHFDIIHSHFDVRTASYAPLVDTPTISTLHSPLTGTTRDILRHFAQTQYYASISDNQRKGLPELNYATTAYNGIELEKIPFFEASRKEDYLIFAGRIAKEKGADIAIEIAKKLNLRLLLCGSAEEGSEYWLEKIQPHVDDNNIVFKGMMPREELFTLLGKARAFIFPLQWDEPFGLVAIEAMATGTPVIALRHGALPEIVKQGETGFICDTPEEMITAIDKIETINPAACRRRVEEMFTVAKMADAYEAAYTKILER